MTSTHVEDQSSPGLFRSFFQDPLSPTRRMGESLSSSSLEGTSVKRRPQNHICPPFTKIEQYVLGVAAAAVLGCHVLLLIWWEELSDVPGRPSTSPRGGMPFVNNGPSQDPGTGYCWGNLPAIQVGGCPEAVVENVLEGVFRQAGGYWAGGADEVAVIEAVASDAGGPPARCKEETYSEVSVEGLRTILQALAAAIPGSQEDPKKTQAAKAHATGLAFNVLLDLGAGPGRTAAAAALLGLAQMAIGIELGSHRFAVGCLALARNSSRKTGPPVCGVKPVEASQGVAGLRLKGSATVQPQLHLLRGDMRHWPHLLEGRGLPDCDDRWAVLLNARCLRDALIVQTIRAVSSSCSPGVRLALLARRAPEEALQFLEDVGRVQAKTSLKNVQDVFLYRLKGPEKR